MIRADELEATIRRLREQGTDDALVEVKRCQQGLSADIWESVSAFGNTSGGLIICGLYEDDAFSRDEGFEYSRVRDQFVSGIGDGGQPSKLTHPPRYELSRGIVDGASVLLIEVHELDIREKPCYITARGVQGGSFKRVDDKDIRLSPSEIFELQSVLLPSDADGDIVPEAAADDLDARLIDLVIAERRRKSPRALRGADTRERQLERLNITNRAGAVRLAGLLAVGLYPQQYYPKLVVDVAVHPGVRKSEPDAPRFLDRQICDGPLTACIEDALAVIGRNIRTISYVSGSGRRDEWEVPEEVLREAIANALLHREYSAMFLGEAVTVDIYPDRIEITNPGGLWGGKTVENLEDGQSRCRNAKLMDLMSAVPLESGGGYVAERQGSGIASMIREMETRSLGRPIFDVKPDSFRVVLARHGAELEDNRAWVISHAGRELERKEETLVSLLRGRATAMTVSGLRAELGWDSDDIRAMCSKLIEDGLLEKAGADVYQLASAAAALKEKSPLAERILNAMHPGVPVSARELASTLDVTIERVRYALPKLIEGGFVEATAPRTSRNRRYVLR